MATLRHASFMFICLVVFTASCSSSAPEVLSVGVSIASRGESLGATVAAPAPVVMPAATPEDFEVEAESNVESAGDCAVSENLQFETEVVVLVNEARTSAGLPSLSEHALLTQVARQHSEEMACGGFLDHESPASGTTDMRIEAAGYRFYAIGENIAMGYTSPEEVVKAWLASEGHRDNLLGAEYSQIGIGFAQKTEDEQTRYWTILFAFPKNP